MYLKNVKHIYSLLGNNSNSDKNGGNGGSRTSTLSPRTSTHIGDNGNSHTSTLSPGTSTHIDTGKISMFIAFEHSYCFHSAVSHMDIASIIH